MKLPDAQAVWRFLALHAVGITLAAATFAFDVLLPLGVAAAVLYTLLVLWSLREPGPGLTWFAAVSCTVLAVLGFALSPPGAELWEAVANRLLSIFVIWLTAYFCLDQKRKAMRIENDRAALMQSERMASLGQMAAGIAHELGNPLAALQGRIELLEMQVGSERVDAAGVLKATAIITELTERMSRIIRGMRTFARDASSDPMRPAPISRVIQDVLEFSREHLRSLDIDVRVGIPDAEVVVYCREPQISQVLVNLVGNAADAIRHLPERWIRVELSKTEDSVEIAVTDSGPGIPPEIRTRVMDPFFTTKDAGTGTGLGLSISQGIVEGHSGSLWIDTECPNTRFVLSLPSNGSPSPPE